MPLDRSLTRPAASPCLRTSPPAFATRGPSPARGSRMALAPWPGPLARPRPAGKARGSSHYGFPRRGDQVPALARRGAAPHRALSVLARRIGAKRAGKVFAGERGAYKDSRRRQLGLCLRLAGRGGSALKFCVKFGGGRRLRAWLRLGQGETNPGLPAADCAPPSTLNYALIPQPPQCMAQAA